MGGCPYPVDNTAFVLDDRLPRTRHRTTLLSRPADPAISGVTSSPSWSRYSSSVRPPRAAYPRIPSRPTSPKGVIFGISVVTVMPSPARHDYSWA